MKIPDIHTQPSPTPPTDPTRHATHDTVSIRQPTDRPVRGEINSDAIDLSTRSASYALRKFKGVNAVMNEVANSIRIADETMQHIGARIVEMKSALTEVFKQYPPFPPGSEERVALLKRFSALRRQIDALSFPPEDVGAQRILSVMGEDKKVTLNVELGFAEYETAIRGIPVHTGPQGLDIPDLHVDAENEQIRQVLDHLSQAQKKLEGKREQLTANAERIIQMQ